MNLIIDFYKSLDMLNLIIFWGIIIVIILLLIFSFILVNKNKKLKKIVETGNLQEDLPIKKIEDSKEIPTTTNKENLKINQDITKEEKSREIQEEKKFVAEEYIMNYHNVERKEDDEKSIEEKKETSKYQNKEIEIPTKPYQRNVLKEMALSQTSPIGITKPKIKEEKNIAKAKELEQALNDSEDKIEILQTKEEIKKDLSKITVIDNRNTEIIDKHENRQTNNKLKESNLPLPSHIEKKQEELSQKKYKFSEPSKIYETKKIENHIGQEKLIQSPVKELLDSIQEPIVKKQDKSSSEIYLEEVSKKLSEAEITDEIDRTEYELEQEENAIISYKELMEKKDSIQTIDEEEAIISIEELMNRNAKQQEQKESQKLYNINEEEETDEFINELKKFRSDL